MKYETGQQPCDRYEPKDDLFPGSGNVHECFCKVKEQYCGYTVSFCTNCNKDHHEGGYQGCICKMTL